MERESSIEVEMHKRDEIMVGKFKMRGFLQSDVGERAEGGGGTPTTDLFLFIKVSGFWFLKFFWMHIFKADCGPIDWAFDLTLSQSQIIVKYVHWQRRKGIFDVPFESKI